MLISLPSCEGRDTLAFWEAQPPEVWTAVRRYITLNYPDVYRSYDLNGDGIVNGADFGALLAAWGPCADCPEDLNGDGTVSGADVGLILSYWGDCTP